MANLLDDDGALWETKTDPRPLGAGDNSTGFTRAADLNSARQWVSDIKDSLRGGTTPVLATGTTTRRTLGARFAEYVNAKDYGVTGDGATSDTAALQALLNTVGALDLNERPAIHLPAGTYRVGDLTVPSRQISIVGDGQESTTLEYTGTTGAMFTLGTFSATPATFYAGSSEAQNFRLQGLRLYHAAGDSTLVAVDGTRTATAVRDNGCGDLILEDLVVRGFKYGVFAAYGSDFDSLRRINFFACDVGAYLGPKSDQFRAQEVQFTACREGLVVDGATQGKLDSCYFVDCSLYDVNFEANSTNRAGVTDAGNGAYEYRWALTDCWHESNAGYGGGGRGPTHHIQFGGNRGATYPRHVSVLRPYVVAGGTNVGTVAFINVTNGRNVRLADAVSYGSRLSYWLNEKASHFAPMYVENVRTADGFTTPAVFGNAQVGQRYFDPFENRHVAYASGEASLELRQEGAQRVRLRNNGDDSFSLQLWDGTSAWLDRVKFALGGARIELNTRTIHFATAAPTSGTWVAGSVVFNAAPAVGSPKGWRCTVGGTPGTWVSEGNL